MPWRAIFTSGPVWAIIVANFCVDWGLYTYLTNIPTFFYEVLFFDIKSVTVAKKNPSCYCDVVLCELQFTRIDVMSVWIQLIKYHNTYT